MSDNDDNTNWLTYRDDQLDLTTLDKFHLLKYYNQAKRLLYKTEIYGGRLKIDDVVDARCTAMKQEIQRRYDETKDPDYFLEML